MVAITVSARCKSSPQLKSTIDEDLRVEINGLQCREVFPQKHVQLFNVPPAFNGTSLRGLQKTVVFLTVLGKGQHVVSLIPRPHAVVEEIDIQELTVSNNAISLNIEKRAENGDRRPWYTFVLVDLPLNKITIEATVERRFWDSDDVKIILNDEVKRNVRGGRHRYWFIIGGILGWVAGKQGKRERVQAGFSENLDNGIHYLEIHADRMPVLHTVALSFGYLETDAEKRATYVIQQNAAFIKLAAREFAVAPAIVGAVMYQEQATNVNFVDYLADYVGGLVGVNTSIGVAQIRIDTAAALEKHYPSLNPLEEKSSIVDRRIVLVERLKDPLTNIRYAAAKISFTQNRWKEAGFDITSKPDILGTLYNIEDVYNPVTPHDQPAPSDFGSGVARNYSHVEALLAL